MSCVLSSSASAFGTMLLAFIGSVINGISSGVLIAFITGWISFFSVIRILVAGVLELYLSWKAGTNFHEVEPIDKEKVNSSYESVEPNEASACQAIPLEAVDGGGTTGTRDEDVEQQRERLLDSTQDQPPTDQATSRKSPLAGVERNVTVFGWLGWTWSAIYVPISSTIWLLVNLTSSSKSGVQQFVRALAIGVSALSLTFDYKQRYAAALGKRWGAWAFLTFNLWNAGACVLLGLETLVLLIHGAMNIHNVPIPLVVAYPIFSIVWAAGSWAFLPPIDGERPWPPTSKGRAWTIVLGGLMGAFAGLFVAAPSFSLWQGAKFDERAGRLRGGSAPEGVGLAEYLACESVSVWAKFAAVMP